MTEKIDDFLYLVGEQHWRSGSVPRIWSPQYQTALTQSLISIGWGGVLELTDKGKKKLGRPA